MDPNVKLKLEIERLKIQNKQYYTSFFFKNKKIKK